MAKKGIFSGAPDWWVHFRWQKRTFWKKERKAAARDASEQAAYQRRVEEYYHQQEPER